MQTFLRRDEISKESAFRMRYDAMIFFVHAHHDGIFDVLHRGKNRVRPVFTPLQSIKNAFKSAYRVVKNNGLYHDRRARMGAHHNRVLRAKK